MLLPSQRYLALATTLLLQTPAAAIDHSSSTSDDKSSFSAAIHSQSSDHQVQTNAARQSAKNTKSHITSSSSEGVNTPTISADTGSTKAKSATDNKDVPLSKLAHDEPTSAKAKAAYNDISFKSYDDFDEYGNHVLDPCEDAIFHLQDQALTKEDVRSLFGEKFLDTLLNIGDSNSTEGILATKNIPQISELAGNERDQTSARRRRAVTADPMRIWPHGIVPYVISANFTGTQRQTIKQAMRHWELHTCVTFIERTDETEYILFTARPCGCCSFVGKKGDGPQAISIGKNCDKFGIVTHELGHVIGFWHEHTRPDRDGYIEIQWHNIQQGQEYNFGKMNAEEINSLGFEYDFDSIMHYSRNTFSSGIFVDTIVPRVDPTSGIQPAIGQRVKLSKGDISQARALYACPDCGGTFQESEGIIQSPGWPRRLDSKDGQQSCTWRISVTPGEKIQLRFNQISMFGNNGHCWYDFVEIRDGHYGGSKLIGRFCNNDEKLPDTITSTGSRLWIHFRYTSSVPDVGFELQYMAICGGKLSDNGRIQSPNYPDEYTSRKDCVWILDVPPGKKAALTFDSFEIERDDSCNYDYLEIRDGGDADADLLGRYCGIEIPDDILSTSNKLWARFVSDNSVNKAGFSARFYTEYDECLTMNDMPDDQQCEQTCVNTVGSYECQCNPGFRLMDDGRSCEAACGGFETNKEGVISSPNWPSPYSPSKKCVWQIVAPDQFKITLAFDQFHLEGSDICKYDYVEVRSGMTDSSPKIGKYCGSKIPQSVTSEQNLLRVEFLSDGNIVKKGFTAKYFFDLDECSADNNGGCQHKCINTVGSYKCACNTGYNLQDDGKKCKEASCGRTLKVSSINKYQEIVSPGWPKRYSIKEVCNWKLETLLGHHVGFQVLELDIEPEPQCGYDWLAFWDGKLPGSGDAAQITRLCGNRIPDYTIKSTGNVMNVRFFSDGSIAKKGFKARYHAECGSRLIAKGEGQDLYSHPNFGEPYERGMACEWVITAPNAELEKENEAERKKRRKRMKRQRKLDMEKRREKARRHRNRSRSRKKSKSDENYYYSYGDEKVPMSRSYTSSDDILDYDMDNLLQADGPHHSDSRGINRARLGPKVVPSETDVIELLFEEIELEDEADCSYDYVEIYDGASTDMPLLGRFCGTKKPGRIYSTSSQVLVVFKTDDTIDMKGFQLKFKSLPKSEKPAVAPTTAVVPTKVSATVKPISQKKIPPSKKSSSTSKTNKSRPSTKRNRGSNRTSSSAKSLLAMFPPSKLAKLQPNKSKRQPVKKTTTSDLQGATLFTDFGDHTKEAKKTSNRDLPGRATKRKVKASRGTRRRNKLDNYRQEFIPVARSRSGLRSRTYSRRAGQSDSSNSSSQRSYHHSRRN